MISPNNSIWPGTGYPLGATQTSEGVNFALYSENATRVELYFFSDKNDHIPSSIFILPGKTMNVFHGFVPGCLAGQLYGYHVHGSYKPEKGHRFNSNKLLLDPYAKAITGLLQWNSAVYGYEKTNKKRSTGFNLKDNAPFVPKSIVVNTLFNWEDDKAMRIPHHATVIYELHVKGYTALQKQLPEDCRGSYKGLSHPYNIQYFKDLGITAVELMPVHFFISRRELIEKGLTDYWGYSSIGFFAPHEQYAVERAGNAVHEFKSMVKELHKAGLEVILDVVFNHTGEGNYTGPTICFRGIDNAVYYRLQENNLQYYEDVTGTGNTLNAELPGVLQLIMDALRYWITDMHIDGFRFDLAPALARNKSAVNELSSFFSIICQDPVIQQVKLIAEPWDVGTKGYQVGNFPAGWAEWNDQYRNGMRDYWRNAGIRLEEFILRFNGSPDVYNVGNRTACASINFITAHDGFTLQDLVSYKNADNSKNKSDTPDGVKENRSVNWGVEGETNDTAILHMRKLHKKNLLATLFLSRGTPMLLSGDEMGNSQSGNNNAFCQDNEISWIDWSKTDQELTVFTSRLIAFRKQHPVFSRPHWSVQQPEDEKTEDIIWFLPDGKLINEKKLLKLPSQPVCAFLNGSHSPFRDERGNAIADDSFFVIFNNTNRPLDCHLPPVQYGREWIKMIDTAGADTQDNPDKVYHSSLDVPAFCVMVLKKIS